MIRTWLAVGLMAAAPVAAQNGKDDPLVLDHLAEPCDERASALNLVEPWQRYSEDTSGSLGRIALLDVGTPEVPDYRVMIIARNPGAPTECRIISFADPSLAWTDDFSVGMAQSRGLTGVGFQISADLLVAGQPRPVDTVMWVGMTYPEAVTAVEVWSASAPLGKSE